MHEQAMKHPLIRAKIRANSRREVEEKRRVGGGGGEHARITAEQGRINNL
jgi:hypothetical protein